MTGKIHSPAIEASVACSRCGRPWGLKFLRSRESRRPVVDGKGRREQVHRLIAMGETTKGMALALGISAKTVEYHRMGLMRELGIYDVAGLTRAAVRMGMVEA